MPVGRERYVPMHDGFGKARERSFTNFMTAHRTFNLANSHPAGGFARTCANTGPYGPEGFGKVVWNAIEQPPKFPAARALRSARSRLEGRPPSTGRPLRRARKARS